MKLLGLILLKSLLFIDDLSSTAVKGERFLFCFVLF